MSPIYEDEYLPIERDLSSKHRSRQQKGQQSERDRDSKEREKRGDKENRPL